MPTASRDATRGSDASRGRFGRGTRGQSEVLSVVLLLSVTIAGTGLVVAFGSSALDDSQRASEIDSAEHAMTQLDSKLSLVGLGESTSQSVSLGVDGPVRVEEDTGWMRVRIVNRSDGQVEAVVMNRSLGAVAYDNGDTTIAYQGGGVWKRVRGGTTMISPPEVHYRGTTLTLPLVVVSGNGEVTRRAVLRRDGPADQKYPDADADLRNPVTRAKVNVTVRSEYYEAWGRFFERRTGGQVDVDDESRTVTLTLVTPTERPPISGGIIATASGDELQLDNKAYVDSYNSTEQPYSESSGENGTIVTAGGVELDNKATIGADLVSGGGKVSLDNKHTEITGNLSYKSLGSMRGTVRGWQANNGSAPAVEPVGDLIDTKRDAVSATNNNSDVDDVSGNRLSSGDSTYRLENGSYYLEEIDLGGENLTFDTTEGNITLVVGDDVSLDGTTVEVTGSGTVRVYMDGQSFAMDNHASVSVPGQKSTRFWLYGSPGTQVSFDTHSMFEGVVYAPDSESQSGDITVQSQSEVFGALVGSVSDMDNTAGVHFDEAILSVDDPTGGEGDTTPRVTYVHASVNPVNVTSG